MPPLPELSVTLLQSSGMLKQKKQHKYVAKRWHAIRSYLNDFADSSNPELLHKLRVEVKRLRSFAAFAAGEHAKDMLKPLKKMFRKAGTIREAGLTLSLLQKYHIQAPDVEKATQETIEQKTASFRSRTAYYGRQAEKAGNQLRKNIRPLRNGSVKRWFTAQLAITAGLLAAPPPAQYHNARKQIKNILNVYLMLPKRIADRVALNEDYLHRLQEQIGNWHDIAMAVDLLPPRAKNTRSGGTQLHKDGQQLVRTIRRTARDFMRQVNASSAPQA